MLTNEPFSIEGFAFGVNYGLNRCASRRRCRSAAIRLPAAIASVEEAPGGVQMTLALTFELEGGEKPVCVAETLARLYGG